MKIERDIDIYEFDWWKSFTGHIMLIIVSIILIYLWYDLRDLFHPRTVWRLYLLLVPALVYLPFFLPNLISLYAVPKLIIFKENSIVIVGPFKKNKVFAYEDITRLVVYHDPKWSEPLKWISSRFRARLYFSDNKIKIMFNPDRLFDFPAILETIRNKGLGHVIEQK